MQHRRFLMSPALDTEATNKRTIRKRAEAVAAKPVVDQADDLLTRVNTRCAFVSTSAAQPIIGGRTSAGAIGVYSRPAGTGQPEKAAAGSTVVINTAMTDAVSSQAAGR